MISPFWSPAAGGCTTVVHDARKKCAAGILKESYLDRVIQLVTSVSLLVETGSFGLECYRNCGNSLGYFLTEKYAKFF